jgi:hypothetical protein
MKPVSIIYFRTPTGRFSRWTVVTWHPEFNAVTCRHNGGKPMIRSILNIVTQDQITAIRQAAQKAKAKEKYADVISVVKIVGKDHNKVAEGLNCLPVVAFMKIKACERMGLI